MVLHAAREPLQLEERAIPEPGTRQILVAVDACGVCRTDLHLVDDELPLPKRPVVPGHEIVGTVAGTGAGSTRFAAGDRVGVPWLGSTCGRCRFCRSGRENLCAEARFTGYHLDGGYAEYTVADERYCFPLPATMDPVSAAPLLCAGLIGYRALRLAGDPSRLGLYGFGAAAHLIAQVAIGEGRRVFAFTRAGDVEGQAFARGLGVVWAGSSDDMPPEPLDAAIIFAPVGALVPAALRAVDRGGSVVCAGIHMSEIPAFPYEWLWGERSIRSVANLTRADGDEFLPLAARLGVTSHVQRWPLAAANAALAALRDGRVQGAAVLDPGMG